MRPQHPGARLSLAGRTSSPSRAWDTTNDLLAPSLLPSLSGAGSAWGTQGRPQGQEDIIAISQKSFRSSGAGLGAASWAVGSRPAGRFSSPRLA